MEPNKVVEELLTENGDTPPVQRRSVTLAVGYPHQVFHSDHGAFPDITFEGTEMTSEEATEAFADAERVDITLKEV